MRNRRKEHVVDQSELPDPSGPPRRVVRERSFGDKFAGAVIRLVSASAVVFTLVAISSPPLLGSTRSAKLEWQRRQRLVEQAVAAESGKQSEPTADSLRS